MNEQTPEDGVRVVSAATSPLVTRDMLRAELCRALWIQGVGIVAVVGGIVGVAYAIG